MITRIYADNYRCLVNFEWKPGKLALLVGDNGSGKTSVFDALGSVREFVAQRSALRKSFPAHSRTRWETRVEQKFEIEAVVGGVDYTYGLLVEHHDDDPAKSRVKRETLLAGAQTLMDFDAGELHLFRDNGTPGPTITADRQRSGLGAIAAGRDNKRLTAFKRWLDEDVWFFQPDPRSMSPRTDEDGEALDEDLANFASWYPSWIVQNLGAALKAREDLKQAIPGFESLQVGKTSPRLEAHFAGLGGGPAYSVDFTELSDGQRQLCALYVLLHATVAPGRLVVFDEPDNYVSLREIQPWLMHVVEATMIEGGPQAFFVSHHPEVVDLIAADYGTRFFRDGGPTRIEPFRPVEGITASEAMARGWAGE